MSNDPHHDSILDRAKAWLDRRRRISQLMSDFESFTAFERTAALQELGLTEDDLPRLCAGHMSSGYLDRMLEANGVSPGTLRHEDPELWSALERNCAMCQDWRQCQHDLAAHQHLEGAPAYCVNKDEIEEMRPVNA
jgi:hypothetical protein